MSEEPPEQDDEFNISEKSVLVVLTSTEWHTAQEVENKISDFARQAKGRDRHALLGGEPATSILRRMEHKGLVRSQDRPATTSRPREREYCLTVPHGYRAQQRNPLEI